MVHDSGRWSVDFYDFFKESSVQEGVEWFGDVRERAAKNGARHAVVRCRRTRVSVALPVGVAGCLVRSLLLWQDRLVVSAGGCGGR